MYTTTLLVSKVEVGSSIGQNLNHVETHKERVEIFAWASKETYLNNPTPGRVEVIRSGEGFRSDFKKAQMNLSP